MRRSRLSVLPATALAAALVLAAQSPGQGQAMLAFAPISGADSIQQTMAITGQSDTVVDETLPPGPTSEPVYTPGGPTWEEQEPGWIGEEEEEVRPSLWKRWFGGSGRWASDGRARDFGHPLGGDTWLTRPFSVGFLSGGYFPGNPIPGHVNGTSSYLVGGRLGWDVENFWGVEGRFGYAAYGLQNPNGRPLRKLTTYLLDFDFLYYPFGDTQWRPFFLLGFGFADYRFTDDVNHQIHQTPLNIPFGVGFKYRHNQQWAFRVDLTDNLSFASGENISTMNNISFTGGVEARWGVGARKSYWPWNPTRSYR